jgi:hypothetical protein
MESMSRYPRNLAGAALLFLRASLGLLVLANVHAEAPLKSPGILTILAATLCVGLWIGIFTPFLSGVAFVGLIAYLIWFPATPSLVRIVALMLCVSTAIMGPGAYSIDGILFGGRRVIL